MIDQIDSTVFAAIRGRPLGDLIAVATFVLVAIQICIAVRQNGLSKEALSIVQRQTVLLEAENERLTLERRRREEQLPQLDLWLDDVRPGQPISVLARTHSVAGQQYHRSVILTVRNAGVETAVNYLVELWIPAPYQVKQFFSTTVDVNNVPPFIFRSDGQDNLRCLSFTSTIPLARGEKHGLLGLQLQTMDAINKDRHDTFFWRLTYQGFRYPKERDRGEILVNYPRDNNRV